VVQIGLEVALQGRFLASVGEAIDTRHPIAFPGQFGGQKAFAASHVENFAARAGQLPGIVVAGITPGL
jgi:hypothetical protein